ncbi:MAG: heparan-alpha-glucosaminide N-acetyltransferase domain-containing protein, partial [Nocardioidaceae bacterium]
MKPLVPPGRVIGLDVARALALVGMMATHILAPIEGNHLTVIQQVAGGRASALFAVLAGVSLALMSGRTVPPSGRDLA